MQVPVGFSEIGTTAGEPTSSRDGEYHARLYIALAIMDMTLSQAITFWHFTTT
jgi:hypothetical protein